MHRSKQRIVVCLTSILFKIYIVVVILLLIFLLFLSSVLLLILAIRNIIILIIIKLLLFLERVAAVQVREVASRAIGLHHDYILLAGAS